MVMARIGHRQIVVGGAVVFAGVILLWQLNRFASQVEGGRWILDDFAAYWAAGQLALNGRNPYSPEEVRALQRPLGLRENEFPLVMWYPPWALPVMVPFGLMSYVGGRVVWLLVNLLALLLSAQWLWRLYGGELRHSGWAWLIGVTYVPAFASLVWGQVGPLMLLGVTLFLSFMRTRRWGPAGASTLLMAIKPHLFYLFWLALALWAFHRRRIGVLVAATATLAAATALALVVRPGLIGEYLHTMTNQGPLFWINPTMGSYLRLMLGRENIAAQFLPSGLAALWLVVYWWKHRHSWTWEANLPLIILVSVVTTPYGWVHDQIVFLPAVICCFIGCRGIALRRNVKILALCGYLLINGLPFVAATPVVKSLTPTMIAERLPPGQANQFWLVWMGPGFLIGYLICRRSLGQQQR